MLFGIHTNLGESGGEFEKLHGEYNTSELFLGEPQNYVLGGERWGKVIYSKNESGRYTSSTTYNNAKLIRLGVMQDVVYYDVIEEKFAGFTVRYFSATNRKTKSSKATLRQINVVTSKS